MDNIECPPDELVSRPGPCATVLFGATGDLTRRKLIPALFYLATPPNNFAQIAERLSESGLVHNNGSGTPWARIVVEKPFGYDLDTARRLNEDLRAIFTEEQIYRIDHYLGKETVQNIL